MMEHILSTGFDQEERKSDRMGTIYIRKNLWRRKNGIRRGKMQTLNA